MQTKFPFQASLFYYFPSTKILLTYFTFVNLKPISHTICNLSKVWVQIQICNYYRINTFVNYILSLSTFALLKLFLLMITESVFILFSLLNHRVWDDELSADLNQCIAESIISLITYFINLSFQTGKFPDLFKYSVVVPVPKIKKFIRD